MHDTVDHPRAGPAGARVRILEERDVRARGAFLVRVEEVVDGGVILVDRLLHHPQPEHPHVEVDVARRIAGDRRDVVDAFELHTVALSTASSARCTPSASTSKWVTARTDRGPTGPITHAVAPQSGAQPFGVVDLEDHDVRLDLAGIERDAGQRRQPDRQRARVLVVVGQPVDVVVERVQRARGDDPGLPQRAAEHLLVAPRLLDQFGRAREARSKWCAEALREVQPRGVEAPRELGRGHAGRDHGVHQPRAVHVESQTVLVRDIDHAPQLLQRPHAAAGHVRRLLDGHQS